MRPSALSVFYGMNNVEMLSRVVCDDKCDMDLMMSEIEAVQGLQALVSSMSAIKNQSNSVEKLSYEKINKSFQNVTPLRNDIKFNVSSVLPKKSEDEEAYSSQQINKTASVESSQQSKTEIIATKVKATIPVSTESPAKKGSRYSAFRKTSDCPFCKEINLNCGKVAAKCPNRPCNSCGRRHRLNRCRKIGCKHCPGDHLSSKCPIKIRQWAQASVARRRVQRLNRSGSESSM